MKTVLFSLITLAVISCAGPSKSSVESDTARFNQHMDQAFESELSMYPQRLTNFGRKDRYHELNDFTEEFSVKTLERNKTQLRELDSFDRSRLDAQAQLTYDLYKKQLTESIADFQWKDYRYQITQHGGIHSELPAFMMTKHNVTTEKDLQDYISRLGQFKRVFEETVQQIKRSASKGILQPKFTFPYVIETSQNVIQGAPFTKAGKDSPLFADFKVKLASLKLTKEKNKELTAQAERALLESVQPAYVNLVAVLNELAPKATAEDGAWKFPRGDEYYNTLLKRFTTTNMSADEIFDLGMKNVERLRADMIAIQQKLGIKGSLPTLFKATQNDPKQYYPDTAAGRAAYLRLAGQFRDFMASKIPDYFRLIPKTPFEIRAVEKFREKSAGKAFYERPSDDGQRPGVYYVNLGEMKDVPKFEAEALLYHEGIPGHHFQIALTIETKNLPKFRRYNYHTAFTEGWGLYTERLGKDMGGYQDDYSELGRLSMEMLRAARLVVDTGIHHKKWSREKALEFFREILPVSEGSQREQIERYIVMPGQATAYMVGMLKIFELRERAKTQLGPRFSMADFHDVVLRNGSMPLDKLEVLVNEYIKVQQL